MHYKNGREAKDGDTVIGKMSYGRGVIVGIITDLGDGGDTCNGTLVRPAGLIQTCITVKDFVHADDAWEYTTAHIAPPSDAPTTNA